MYEQHAHQMVDKVEATNINNSQTNTYIFMLRGQDISIYFHLSSVFSVLLSSTSVMWALWYSRIVTWGLCIRRDQDSFVGMSDYYAKSISEKWKQTVYFLYTKKAASMKYNFNVTWFWWLRSWMQCLDYGGRECIRSYPLPSPVSKAMWVPDSICGSLQQGSQWHCQNLFSFFSLNLLCCLSNESLYPKTPMPKKFMLFLCHDSLPPEVKVILHCWK